MVFPVVMYRCESWTIRKAERWRIDAFKLCWRRLLRVPWIIGRSNQLILKEINPEYSLEGLMLKLKLQSYYSLERPWCWERLKAGGEGNDKGWDGWMASLTRWTEFEQARGFDDGQGSLACCSPWDCKESDSTERLNWIVTSLVYGYGRKYSISHCFGKEMKQTIKYILLHELLNITSLFFYSNTYVQRSIWTSNSKFLPRITFNTYLAYISIMSDIMLYDLKNMFLS